MNAKALAYTCYQMYARSPTGLAPEYWTFDGDGEPAPPPSPASRGATAPAVLNDREEDDAADGATAALFVGQLHRYGMISACVCCEETGSQRQ
jgi:hypothetical protein